MHSRPSLKARRSPRTLRGSHDFSDAGACLKTDTLPERSPLSVLLMITCAGAGLH